MVAYLIGLKLQITDYECPEEVKDVKMQHIYDKTCTGFNVVVLLVLILYVIYKLKTIKMIWQLIKN